MFLVKILIEGQSKQWDEGDDDNNRDDDDDDDDDDEVKKKIASAFDCFAVLLFRYSPIWNI